MYLALCGDNAEDLDAVCSLLDAWVAEHGAAVRRKAFQSAAELLKFARLERFTLYLIGCDDAGSGRDRGRPRDPPL